MEQFPQAGDRIGLFKLNNPIGAGAAGMVYRALHTQTGQEVALKLVHQSKEAFFRRVYTELDTLRSIRHDNVVRVYAAGQDGPYAYLAMEYIPGEGVLEWVNKVDGKARTRRVLKACAQVAAGLGAVHEAGVLHRDLKPENVLVDKHGIVKLLDFGTARFLDGADVDNHVAGTLRYMAPEQLAGTDIDRRADLFSLGVLLFEMLSGRPLHLANDTARLILAQCTEPSQPVASLVPELPPSAASIVDRLLAIAPADRPRSAGEVAVQLNKALGERIEAAEERTVVLTSRFVGRSDLTKELVRRALDANGGVAVLRGPPGIGLSRLVREVRGDVVVRGGKPALVTGGTEILRDVLDTLAGPLVPQETRQRLLGPDRKLLLDSFPELRRKGERGAEARPYQRVRLATARVLKRAAAERKLLIIVDDAERAHPTDLRCLLGHGLLLLTTHRPERLEIMGEAIEVPPLAPGAMAEMARSMIGDGGATLAWEEAGLLAGNPGELARRAIQWAHSQVPSRPAFADAPGDGMTWAQALARAQHLLVADRPEEVLACFELPADTAPPAGALRYGVEMARARAWFLLGEDSKSLVSATRAGEVAPDTADRNRARLEGARCALRRGHYGACLEEAQYCWRQALELGDHELAASWAALEVNTLVGLGRLYEAEVVADKALSAANEAGARAVPLLWSAARVASSLCDWNEALTRIAAVRKTLRTKQVPRLEAGMYLEEGKLELRRGQVARALSLLMRADEILAPLGDSELLMELRAHQSHALLLDGQVERARSTVDEGLALADKTGSRVGLLRGIICGLRYSRIVSDADLTLELLERVAELPPNWADEPAAAVLHAERAMALLQLGDAEGAERAVRLALAIDVEDPHDTLWVRLRHAQLLVALGEPEAFDEELVHEAEQLGVAHIARMARGLGLRLHDDTDPAATRAAREAGDVFAACWLAGAGPDPSRAAEDARERGFTALLNSEALSGRK